MKAGLDTARAKGKRVIVDARRIAMLRKDGASWATICRQTGLSKGTAQRALHALPKTIERGFGQVAQDFAIAAAEETSSLASSRLN